MLGLLLGNLIGQDISDLNCERRIGKNRIWAYKNLQIRYIFVNLHTLLASSYYSSTLNRANMFLYDSSNSLIRNQQKINS